MPCVIPRRFNVTVSAEISKLSAAVIRHKILCIKFCSTDLYVPLGCITMIISYFVEWATLIKLLNNNNNNKNEKVSLEDKTAFNVMVLLTN